MMKKPKILLTEQRKELEKFTEFLDKVADIIKERDQLRQELATATIPKSEGWLAEILQRALDGEPGWREKARHALGTYTIIICEGCQNPFRSGGKRKKICGECKQ